MHDELGQALTGIRLFLSTAEKTAHIPDSQTGDHIRVCLQEVEKAMGSVRRMIHALRPPALDELGLLGALRKEADSFAQRTGVRCELDMPDESPLLSKEEVTTVFRVAQESLTNVARHAHANCVMMCFGVSGDGLCLCVEDDGKGITAARENFGLRGMRERAALLNGSLQIQPRLEGGTLVRLQLPRTQVAVAATA